MEFENCSISDKNIQNEIMTTISLKLSKKYLTLFVFNKAKAKTPGKAEKPEKRTRKKKDADAPKKPMSAFFWYQGSRRENLKKEEPNLGHKEVIVVSN